MKKNLRLSLLCIYLVHLSASNLHAELATTATVATTATLKATSLGALLKTGAVAAQTACQAHPVIAATTGVVTLTIICVKWYNKPVPLCTDPEKYTFISYAPVNSMSENERVVSYTDIAALIKARKHDQLQGCYITTKEQRTIAVQPEIPEGETRPILVKFVPLVCCFDARTNDRGAYAAFKAHEQEVAQDTVAVSYVLPTYDHRSFDFGGPQTQQLFSNILNKIAQKNPKAPLIVDGVCASATGVINTLANPELAQDAKPQIVAATVESPAISSEDTWRHMGEHEIPWPLNKLLGPVMAPCARQYFPSCTPTKSNEEILNTYEHIPPHITMLIARKDTDKTVSSDSIDAIVEKMQKNGNNVELYEDTNPKFVHGFMVKDPKFRNATAAFLARVTAHTLTV